MKTLFLVLLASCGVFGQQLATPPVAPQAMDCAHDATTFKCVQYVRNYDADTITFNIHDVHPLIGKNISVRVRHIDTPEIKGKLPCEKEAARIAKRLIENLLKNAKRIDLENADKDKYFRILADVVVDGRYLKDLLLKNNLAYAYEGATKEKNRLVQALTRGISERSLRIMIIHAQNPHSESTVKIICFKSLESGISSLCASKLSQERNAGHWSTRSMNAMAAKVALVAKTFSF